MWKQNGHGHDRIRFYHCVMHVLRCVHAVEMEGYFLIIIPGICEN